MVRTYELMLMVHAAITSMICCPHSQPAWGPNSVASSSSWSQPLLMTHALVRPSVVWTLIKIRKSQIGFKRLKPLDYYIRPLPLPFHVAAGSQWLTSAGKIQQNLHDTHTAFCFLPPMSPSCFTRLGTEHFFVFACFCGTRLYVFICSARWGWVWPSSSSSTLVETPLENHSHGCEVGVVHWGARVSRSWLSCSHAVTSTHELSVRHIPAACP